MSKTTGLAAFTRKGMEMLPQKENIEKNQYNSKEIRKRERGKKDLVALTIRLSRADWERLHQLAVSDGVSIQSLAVEGLSKIFKEKGLPALLG